MEKLIDKVISWIPRIFSILIILLLIRESLQILDADDTTGKILINLLLSTLPVIFFLIVLILSWKHEIVGAVVYFLAGFIIIAIAFISMLKDKVNPLLGMINPASFVLFFIGILFLVGWMRKKIKAK